MDKLTHFELLIAAFITVTDVVVKEKDENIQNNGNSKPRPSNFISFLFLIGQVILSDL